MTTIAHATPTEARIATALVGVILGSGHRIAVLDEEGVAQRVTADRALIEAALAQTEMNVLSVYRVKADGLTERVGGITLIWGNGDDLISDYSDVPIIAGLVRSAEARCGRLF